MQNNKSNLKLAKQYSKPTGATGQRMGKIFDEENMQQNDWTIALLNIKPTDYVLEIGFGSGRSIKQVAKLAHHGLVAGIDYSNVMLKQATRRNATAISTGLVKLRFGNAAILPYPNNYFNKVFAVYVIYFWPQPLTVLKEIQRVIKPLGKVAIYLSAKQALANTVLTQTGLFKTYSKTELTKMFQQVGFKKITFRNKTFDQKTGWCVLASK